MTNMVNVFVETYYIMYQCQIQCDMFVRYHYQNVDRIVSSIRARITLNSKSRIRHINMMIIIMADFEFDLDVCTYRLQFIN